MRITTRILLLSLALAAPAFAQTRPATTSAPASQPATKPAAPRFQGVLPLGSKVSLNVPHASSIDLRFAACGGPFLMMNASIYRLTDGQVVGQLPEKLRLAFAQYSLSADGALLAHSAMGKREISIYSTESGEVVRTLTAPFDAWDASRFLSFAGKSTLVYFASGTRRENRVVAWNALTGQLKGEIKFTDKIESADVSFDGKIAAVAFDSEIVCVDLVKMTLISRIRTAARTVRNVRLSPDATELAVTGRKDGYRLAVMDLHGKVLFDAPCAQITGGRGRTEEALQFLPDKSGILIDGRYLLDRRIGKVSWQIDPFHHAQPSVVIMNDAQVLTFEDPGDRNYLLRTVDIPRPSLDAAVAALAHPAPDAALKPRDTVRLDLQLKNVRFGTPDQTREMLTDVLTRRLALNDLTASPKGDIVLQVTYDEAADPNVTNVVEGNKVVGTTSQTAVRCDLKMLARDQKTVLFERSMAFEPAQYGVVSSTKPEDLRAAKVGVLLAELSRLNIPLLIQGDLRLPVQTTMRQPR